VREHAAVAQRRVEDRHVIEQRAVTAAEIANERAAVDDAQLAVKLRHRAVGDRDVRARIGPDHESLGREHVARARLLARGDRQLALAHDDARRAARQGLGGSRVRQSSVSPCVVCVVRLWCARAGA
jgi:hypothetical protein